MHTVGARHEACAWGSYAWPKAKRSGVMARAGYRTLRVQATLIESDLDTAVVP